VHRVEKFSDKHARGNNRIHAQWRVLSAGSGKTIVMAMVIAWQITELCRRQIRRSSSLGPVLIHASRKMNGSERIRTPVCSVALEQSCQDTPPDPDSFPSKVS
jgi:hypothetical protein